MESREYMRRGCSGAPECRPVDRGRVDVRVGMYGRTVRPDGGVGGPVGSIGPHCPGTVTSDRFTMESVRAFSDARSMGATPSLCEVYGLPAHVVAAHSLLGSEFAAVERYCTAKAREDARAKHRQQERQRPARGVRYGG